MASITAAQFERRHGELVRTQYAEYTGHEALRTVLLRRHPPIDVPSCVLHQWLKRSMKPADAVTVTSTKELEEKDGAVVKSLAKEHATAYKLCQA